jgi:sugar lactone lactonase YvrE
VVNFQKDGTIGFVKPNGEVQLYLTLPEGSTANSIKFSSKGTMYLADFSGHNVLQVNMKNKKVSVYVHNDAFNQPNDLCINSKNQLFASDPNWKASTGQIWRIDKGGKAVLLEANMGTTNGIELSPDEKTLYVAESATNEIWSYRIEGDTLTAPRLLKKFSDFEIDGIRTDRDGRLYVARILKGTIAVLAPDGTILREIPLGASEPTNLAFGGPDGKTVFVTQRKGGFIEAFRVDRAGREFCLQQPNGCADP